MITISSCYIKITRYHGYWIIKKITQIRTNGHSYLENNVHKKFDEDNEILLWSDFEDAMKLPEITKLFIRKITFICNLKDYSQIIF